MRTIDCVVTIMLGVVAFTGCSKETSTVQSTSAPAVATNAPRTTTTAAAKRVATMPPKTPSTAAAASTPSVKATAKTIAVTKTATPATTHGTSSPIRATTTPAPIAATPRPAVPSPSATSSAVAVVTGDTAHGKQLYTQSCANCHGASGQGGIGPSLQNEASRKNLDQTIAWIKNPNPPMPKLYPGSLSEKDVLDIATYVQSLK